MLRDSQMSPTEATRTVSTSETLMLDPLSPDLLRKMHAYWRAANYLSVGQIYLQDNPLLEFPAEARTYQTPFARTLGHDTGIELSLRPP